MRKHFLLLFLMALLPLAGWAALVGDPAARDSVYSGALQPLVTAGSGATYYAVVPHGAADPGVNDYSTSVPTRKNAGTYDVFWCVPTGTVLNEDDLDHATKIVAHIYPKELVYFLTGSTYAVGDSAEISRHYSLASGYSFIGNEKLSDYAKFEFPSNTVDLHLDSLGRFTTTGTYDITALKVVPNATPQNYDFRFTSTAVIVVTGKSIANFIAKPVDDQAYTGDSIKPTPVAIYASIADSTAHRALNPANYKVTYGENKNVGAGSGKIIYTGIGDYEGTLEVPFNITPRQLASVTVGAIADTTYTAAEIEPVLTVKGKDANNKEYTLVYSTDPTGHRDYAVHYNGTNINVSDTTAVGTLTADPNGNFIFPSAANKIGKAKFKILPKSLNSEDITIAAIAPQLYTAGNITPTSTVTWTRDTTVINVTSYIMWEYQNNKEVGTATIIAKADTTSTNVGAKNYTGQKTSTFDIIPTDLATAHAKIDFKKRVNDSTFVDAVYKYIGRDIKPGTIDEDGELYVTVMVGADSVRLQQDVDYKIISYGDSVTIGTVGYKGDNKNVSVDDPTKTRGTVTIQGIGNFGKINALAEPINISEVFLIGKKQLRLTAAPNKSTIYGAKPSEKFAYEDNTVEDSTKTAEVLLGGKVTYKLYSYDPRQASPTYTSENTDSVALAITDSTRAYKYVPVWTNLPADTTGVSPKIEGVTYQSAAQKAARANYDLEGTILTDSAVFVINAAKWFIVPDSLSKKYMVTDDAIEISNKFKVYAGSTFETADPVANPIFDVAPVIGRKEADKGENVIVTAEPGVYGSYTVSVLNDSIGGVRKTGYEIECLTGKLTILPFPITITANDQTVLYGGAPNTETKANSWIRTVNADGEEVAGNLLTVTYSPVMFGNQSLINRDSLGLTLEWDSVATVSATPHADALIPHITNTNFAPTYVNGSLTVIAGNIMVLGRTDATCKDVIIAHDGVDSVTVKFEDRELSAETWQAMAFPFPVSVAEFSNAIYKATNGVGYAVVNILDEANTGDKPAFKLWMREIEANQPFLFKVYTGKTGNDLNKFDMKDLEFKGKTITYAEQAESHDVAQNFFYGTYQTTTLANQDGEPKLYWLFNHNSGKFSKYTGNSRTIKPMTGYLKTATEIDAFARITVVEEDGTVTAISTINADGEAVKADGWYTINGVKLQGMPTEKGVYIQNGKKVVLK